MDAKWTGISHLGEGEGLGGVVLISVHASCCFFWPWTALEGKIQGGGALRSRARDLRRHATEQRTCELRNTRVRAPTPEMQLFHFVFSRLSA